MAGEVWVARASGGVQVAMKIIHDLELLGSQRELGALRIVREVKHPNLCPLFGVWFFDAHGNLLDAAQTEAVFYRDPSMAETTAIGGEVAIETESDDDGFVATQAIGTSAPIPPPSLASERPNYPLPSRMVVAMGLGEKTLFDRLQEVLAEKPQTKESERGGIEVHELLQYLNAAASAIDELNKRYRIYHCDIKPQNILVVGGQAQVCDFGLARQVVKSRQTQMAFGTPAYGAPEMLFDRTYSKTIDQYSLAITYYELRTGSLPFDRMTQSSLLQAKASGKLNLTWVSARERKVIAKATRLDPTKRYPDCQTFVAELKASVDHPRSSPRLARPMGLLASVLVLIASLGFAVWFFFGNQVNQPVPRKTIETTSDLVQQDKPRPPVEPFLETPSLDNDMRSESDLVGIDESRPVELEPQPMVAEPIERSVSQPNFQPIEPPIELPVEPPIAQPRDLSFRLKQAATSNRSAKQRIVEQTILLQDAKADELKALDPELLDALVDDISTTMQVQFDAAIEEESVDQQWLDQVDETIGVLGPILSRSYGNDRLLARLALAQLQRLLASKPSESLDAIVDQADEVRRWFEPSGSYAEPNSTADAAFAIVYSWPRLWDQNDWDIRLAKSDFDRVFERNDEPSKHAATLTKLHGQYQLNVGWTLWQRDQPRPAFEAWRTLAENPGLSNLIIADDRERAAKHLLDWLVRSSKTTDDEIDSLRYSRFHQSAAGVLDVIERFATESDEVRQALAAERLLCNVAAGNFKAAEDSLSRIEKTVDGRLLDAMTPQLGRAVFDLASRAASDNAVTKTKWVDLLCIGCLAQTTDNLFRETEAAKRKRRELFVRCYRPVMAKQRSRLRSSELAIPVLNDDVDAAVFGKYCDAFVVLAANPEGREIYQDILTWLGDVEIAAAIAGQVTGDAVNGANRLCTACEAFMQSRYEQQDDIGIDEIIRTMQQYHGRATERGNTPRSDFLLARIYDQKGFAESDMGRSMSFYQDAIRRYDRLLDSINKEDEGFRGSVLRCRASVRQRHAAQLAPSQRELLQQQALTDARQAIGLRQTWHADNDDRLETLAEVAWAIANKTTSLPMTERNKLFDEAAVAIDQAIELRRRHSLDYTQLAIKKLNGLWIDMLRNPGAPRAEKAKGAATEWMNEISDRAQAERSGRLASLTIRADSVRLVCQWHSRAARIYDMTGDKTRAIRHSEKGFEIASSSLDLEDPQRHINSLEYVILKSESLGNGNLPRGNRSSNRALVEELKTILSQIQNPRPEILETKQLFVDALEKY